MSKNYKKKRDVEDVVIEENELSKKEIYDMNKKKKEEEKQKLAKKKSTKKKNKTESHQTNLIGRIFAVVMLLLMIGSVIASFASYFR